MQFLRESLVDLDETFQKYGGRLYVFHGDPVEVFSKLFEVKCIVSFLTLYLPRAF